MLHYKNMSIPALLLTLLSLTAYSSDFFKATEWQVIESEIRPAAKDAANIPKIEKLPNELKQKLAMLRTNGLGLEFVTYPSGQATKMRSAAYLAFGNKHLYVMLSGEQGADYELKASENEEETAHIWYDDNFEVFIDPFLSRNDYMHFIVNPLGELYDARCFINMVSDPKAADQTELIPEMEADMAYSSNAQVDVVKNDTEWSVLLSIPFSGFGIDAAPLGHAWGFNFCHTNREIKELSQWKPTSGRLGFHTPALYGTLIFGDKKPRIESDFSLGIPGYGRNILSLRTQNPAAAAEMAITVKLLQEDDAKLLLEKELVVQAGAAEYKLPFTVPYDVHGKFKITANLSEQDTTVGYFLKTMTLQTPLDLNLPLTYIYTSDTAMKGSLKLFLGFAELENAVLAFEIQKDGKTVRTESLKRLEGNYLSFEVATKTLSAGNYVLLTRLLSNDREICVVKKDFEIVTAPFPF